MRQVAAAGGEDVGTVRDSGSLLPAMDAPLDAAGQPPRASVIRRPMPRRARRTSTALALSRLEREHVALLLAICELEGPASAIDPNSQSLRDALLPMLREDLRQAQHALRLVTDGRYGICEDCHSPLTSRQLELKPASTRCSACESRRYSAIRD